MNSNSGNSGTHRSNPAQKAVTSRAAAAAPNINTNPPPLNLLPNPPNPLLPNFGKKAAQKAPKSDLQALQDGHRFLRSGEDDRADNQSWESKVSQKYYDSLHKDFVIADLRDFDGKLSSKKLPSDSSKTSTVPTAAAAPTAPTAPAVGKIGFRWRTEMEVR
jgi:hypothetical protein